MVLIEGYQPVDYFTAQLTQIPNFNHTLTINNIATLIQLYTQKQQLFLGISSLIEHRTLPILPIELFHTQIHGLTHYNAILTLLPGPNFDSKHHFLTDISYSNFMQIHSKIVSKLPQMHHFELSADMPKFLQEIIFEYAKSFPFITVTRSIKDPFSVVLEQKTTPNDTFLVTAPFTDSKINFIQNNLLTNKVNKSIDVAKTVNYQFNKQLHILRSPNSFNSKLLKNTSETPHFLSFKNITLISFLYFFDAIFFNELPNLLDYSISDLSPPKPLQFPLLSTPNFAFKTPKFHSFTPREIEKQHRKNRLFEAKILPEIATFQFKFGLENFIVSRPAVNVANFELRKLNSTVKRLYERQKIFPREVKELSDFFPVDQFLAHRSLYVYNSFLDDSADCFLKSEIVRLGLQNAYAKKISDKNGRKYELSELVKGIQERKYGAINEASQGFVGVVLSCLEVELARELEIEVEVFKKYKILIEGVLKRSRLTEVSVVTIMRYLPFNVAQCQKMKEFYCKSEIQRKYTAGSFVSKKSSIQNNGQVLRTGNSQLLDANNCGVFSQILNVFQDYEIDQEEVQKYLAAGSFKIVNQMCDDVIAYYEKKY